MILKIFSILICVIFVGNFLLCYLRSKGKYDEYMEYVDKEEYGLKDFIPLGLLKAESTWTEKIMPMQLKTILASHNNQVYQKVLELHGPKDVEFYYYIHSGYRLAAAILASAMAAIMGMIMSVQGDTSNGALLSVIAIAANFAVPFLVDTSLKESIEKRRRSIQMEFPEFVNKLTLLVNAGMTISKAWEKIINENTKEHILYDEMRYSLMEIKAGNRKAVAYEEFARRCRSKRSDQVCVRDRYELKRGGSEVVPVLKAQGNECWEMRKNAARQLGEEASTKILIPLMIMFMGIVLIVSTPAVLSMTSGM
mgnify:CR=1 FL=1